MDVAQVVARLAETTIAIRFVARGERYWIGTAADADLAIAGLDAFALVDGDARGFVVRAPAGAALSRDGRASGASELLLAAGHVVAIAFGAVSIEIRLVAAARTPVPRRPRELRALAYVAAMLAVQLAIVTVAYTYGTLPRERAKRPFHVARIASQKPPPPPIEQPVPAPAPMPAAAAAPIAAIAPIARGEHAHKPRSVAFRGHDVELTDDMTNRVDSMATVAAAFNQIDIRGALDQVGPIYQPPEPKLQLDLGGAIPAGPYETISHGYGAGDDYDIGLTPCERYQRAHGSGAPATEPNPCDDDAQQAR